MCIGYHELALEQVGEIIRVGAPSTNPDRVYVRFMNKSNAIFHNITNFTVSPLYFIRLFNLIEIRYLIMIRSKLNLVQ